MMYLGKYEVDSINGIDESKYESAVTSAKILWPSHKFMCNRKRVKKRVSDKWWGFPNYSIWRQRQVIVVLGRVVNNGGRHDLFVGPL